MVIDDHTSDARTIENENNEQSLQGYKTPCGLFSLVTRLISWRGSIIWHYSIIVPINLLHVCVVYDSKKNGYISEAELLI